MSPSVALIVSNTAPDSGDVVAARLRHLLERGWEARLFCKGEAWAKSPALRDSGLEGRVEFAPKASSASSPFDSRLRKLRPDLVHFHSGWAAWKGLAVSQSLGCRVVVGFREDGQDLEVPDPERLWRAADLLLFPSAAALERAVARGWPRARAEVLHPAVEGLDANERRSGLDAFRLLSAGPLIWEQGFEDSVQAVRLLLDMGVRCEYRIVGEGEHLVAVAYAVRQLGVLDHVQLLPTNEGDRLAEELRSSDVFVDPAVTDTTPPAALMAARACGLPFVATMRRAGLPDDAGIAVPRRNPRAIAEAVARLEADPELRRGMGQAAREVRGVPTLEDDVARVERLYRQTLVDLPASQQRVLA